MEREEFEEHFSVNFELLNVLLNNKSALDSNSFLGQVKSKEEVLRFMKGYGINSDKPVEVAELFGNFQEALQFIRKHFLKDGRAEGLDLHIPKEIAQIYEISDLFILSTEGLRDPSKIELSLWAGIILKVMHTILHIDKDLRYDYFLTIQTQIFDRYYKYMHRDWRNRLFLRSEDKKIFVPIKEFQTKSKKTRESVIIKLLHKKENVAEELFDRIGVRLITHTKYDVLRVIKFLYDNFMIVPHNIKPSRSHNTLIDIKSFQKKYANAFEHIKNLNSKQSISYFEKLVEESNFQLTEMEKKNKHSLENYQAIHFTCRQLIKYQNPFYARFIKVRRQAQKEKESKLAQEVLKLDPSTISNNLSFFYPYEVQIVDAKSHKQNTIGEASHEEYKNSQLHSAMLRLFKPLLKFKNMDIY